MHYSPLAIAIIVIVAILAVDPIIAAFIMSRPSIKKQLKDFQSAFDAIDAKVKGSPDAAARAAAATYMQEARHFLAGASEAVAAGNKTLAKSLIHEGLIELHKANVCVDPNQWDDED